jgi:tetratricopeptide (TPR) repeat protein
MAKPGRNDRCPCGSGKKYKACCLTTDAAAEHARLAAAQAQREEEGADKRQSLREVRDLIIGKLAGSDDFDDDEFDDDDPTDASNAVLALIRDGKLDEAEAAARALLAAYPELHDGWDRLGMIYEKRGENRQAADCYRKVVAFLDDNPDYSEPAFKETFVALITKLDPPATG